MIWRAIKKFLTCRECGSWNISMLNICYDCARRGRT